MNAEIVPGNGDGKITTVAFRANVVNGGEEDNKTYNLDPGQYFISKYKPI